MTSWVSPALVWPGCAAHLLGDLLGDRDLAPSPGSVLCEVRGLASILSEAPNVLRFCDPNAFERRFSFVLSPRSLCVRRALATMMFSLVFIYSWIFLKPFHPQLSSSLPAPMQSLALSSLCQGNRTRAAMWGVEGVGPEPGTWPPAASCFPLASWGPGLPATPLQLVGDLEGGDSLTKDMGGVGRGLLGGGAQEALFLTKGLKHLGEEQASRQGSGFQLPCACPGAQSHLRGR